jgi:hypothetical protein
MSSTEQREIEALRQQVRDMGGTPVEIKAAAAAARASLAASTRGRRPRVLRLLRLAGKKAVAICAEGIDDGEVHPGYTTVGPVTVPCSLARSSVFLLGGWGRTLHPKSFPRGPARKC